MRKFSLLMMLFLMIGGVAMAQKPMKKESMTPEMRAQKMTDRMVKELSLNEQQAKSVQVLNLQFVEQMKDKKMGMKDKALCDSCKKMVKERKAENHKMRREFKESKELRNDQLKTILTKDQYDLYMKNMKERAEKAQKVQRGS